MLMDTVIRKDGLLKPASIIFPKDIVIPQDFVEAGRFAQTVLRDMGSLEDLNDLPGWVLRNAWFLGLSVEEAKWEVVNVIAGRIVVGGSIN